MGLAVAPSPHGPASFPLTPRPSPIPPAPAPGTSSCGVSSRHTCRARSVVPREPGDRAPLRLHPLGRPWGEQCSSFPAKSPRASVQPRRSVSQGTPRLVRHRPATPRPSCFSCNLLARARSLSDTFSGPCADSLRPRLAHSALPSAVKGSQGFPLAAAADEASSRLLGSRNRLTKNNFPRGRHWGFPTDSRLAN